MPADPTPERPMSRAEAIIRAAETLRFSRMRHYPDRPGETSVDATLIQELVSACRLPTDPPERTAEAERRAFRAGVEALVKGYNIGFREGVAAALKKTAECYDHFLALRDACFKPDEKEERDDFDLQCCAVKTLEHMIRETQPPEAAPEAPDEKMIYRVLRERDATIEDLTGTVSDLQQAAQERESLIAHLRIETAGLREAAQERESEMHRRHEAWEAHTSTLMEEIARLKSAVAEQGELLTNARAILEDQAANANNLESDVAQWTRHHDGAQERAQKNQAPEVTEDRPPTVANDPLHSGSTSGALTTPPATPAVGEIARLKQELEWTKKRVFAARSLMQSMRDKMDRWSYLHSTEPESTQSGGAVYHAPAPASDRGDQPMPLGSGSDLSQGERRASEAGEGARSAPDVSGGRGQASSGTPGASPNPCGSTPPPAASSPVAAEGAAPSASTPSAGLLGELQDALEMGHGLSRRGSDESTTIGQALANLEAFERRLRAWDRTPGAPPGLADLLRELLGDAQP